MCFISEAQQKAFDAIQQRRAAAALARQAQLAAVSATSGHHHRVAAAGPSTAVAAAPMAFAPPQAPLKPEMSLAGLASDPALLHQYIQSIVQQQIAQQVQQQQPLSAAAAAAAVAAQVQQQQQAAAQFSIAHQLARPVVPELPSAYDHALGMMHTKRPADDMLAYQGEPLQKRQKYDEEDDFSTSSDDKKGKKRRFVWTPELHALFERAVVTLDAENVGPKNIHSVMARFNAEVVDASGLNTQHIKSHLQKWRIARRRREDSSSHQEPAAGAPAVPPPELPPHALAPSGMPPTQKLFQSPSYFQPEYATPSQIPSVNVSPTSIIAPSVLSATPSMPGFSDHAYDTPPPQPPPPPVAKSVMGSLMAEPLVDDDALLAAGSWESLLDAGPMGDRCDAKEVFNPLDGMPQDVLSHLNELAPGCGEGMSSAEIMRYMMLGYQLGYQNCFSEMIPASVGSSDPITTSAFADDAFTMGIL